MRSDWSIFEFLARDFSHTYYMRHIWHWTLSSLSLYSWYKVHVFIMYSWPYKFIFTEPVSTSSPTTADLSSSALSESLSTTEDAKVSPNAKQGILLSTKTLIPSSYLHLASDCP